MSSRYVNVTAHLTTPGALLLLALTPPYKALTADRIAHVTKDMLQALGVPMDLWGPHSTRGAGFYFTKNWVSLVKKFVNW